MPPSPTRLWTIAWHEYVTNVRRAGFIFFTLFVPGLGLLGLIVSAFFSGQATDLLESQLDTAHRPIGVVDLSGLFTPVPPEFAGEFIAYAAESGARQALLNGTLSAYLLIPSDYLSTGQITAFSTGGFFSAVTLTDSSVLRAFLLHGLLAGQVDPALVARAADPAEVTPVSLDENGQPAPQSDLASTIAAFLVPYLLSIFLIVAIFTASSYLLRSVSEEKETRVIEVIVSSVSATELLAGKVLGLGALGLTQIGVWLASGLVLSSGTEALARALSPGLLALSVLYFLLGYLLYGTLMAVAGAVGTSLRESQQLAGVLSFGAAVPLMFNGLILASPNAPLVRALSIFPFTAPTAMMLRLPLAGRLPVLDVAASLVGLLVTIPLTLWAGAKIFRLGLLLYGKRPGLREILGALRQS